MTISHVEMQFDCFSINLFEFTHATIYYRSLKFDLTIKETVIMKLIFNNWKLYFG